MTLGVFASLLGGVGLFLLGMWLMTEGLKLAAGGALQAVLESWTRSAPRGFLAGVLITALLQSSSAVTVATLGFVNAGLLSLAQAVWLIIGANVGTTMTGWLVALVGVKIDVAALALPLIGLGMLGRLAFRGRSRLFGAAQAMAGFGAFFLGVGVLQGAFADLMGDMGHLFTGDATFAALLIALALGVLVTVLTQSSSAAIALALTAAASGEIPLSMAAMAVIGTNIGTTSTAILAALSATPAARRVATAHVIFNVTAATGALLLLSPLLWLSTWLTSGFNPQADTPAILAMFHTLFNLLGAVIMALMGARLITFLQRRFVSAEESLARPRYLDPTLAKVPDLALRGLVLEAERMREAAFAMVARRREAGAGAGATDPGQLLPLGRAIRTFIGEMSAGPLPDTVADALPDVIRAVQHLEEIERMSLRLRTPPADIAAASAGWPTLRQALSDSLTGPGPHAADPELAYARLIETAEQAYQQVKTDLLQATARGALPVGRLDDALDLADAVRRCAEMAAKTHRRLGPWEGHPDTAHEEAQAAAG
ncbi:Na/Pi symporter [Brevundimonas sp.]|uniref:Na/Pi cotransporter family protein n=1 Tax=Brevundimonas sp. TaxID=1871086 RepID=UPI001DB97B24|nr:Na/Pi symporter [Brevundimonas sp.]MBA4001362.1 Na/Pi-cotransporter II-like protein [Brevundimonas sp.]